MFKLKKILVDAKHDYIAMLLKQDAQELSLQANERIKVFSSKNKFCTPFSKIISSRRR